MVLKRDLVAILSVVPMSILAWHLRFERHWNLPCLLEKFSSFYHLKLTSFARSLSQTYLVSNTPCQLSKESWGYTGRSPVVDRLENLLLGGKKNEFYFSEQMRKIQPNLMVWALKGQTFGYIQAVAVEIWSWGLLVLQFFLIGKAKGFSNITPLSVSLLPTISKILSHTQLYIMCGPCASQLW